MIRTGEQFPYIASPGLKGWVDFLESDAIDDNATPSVNNVVYDGGFLSPRPGSRLFAAKPTGETAAPLQIIECKTSDQIEYLIAVYGTNFYLYRDDLSVWQKLNHTYTPTTASYFGYVSWNNGRGADYMYACNGVDNFGMWHMATTTVDGAFADSATTVDVVDATRFPASGTVVFKSGGSEFTWAYTSKTATSLTGGGTIGTALSDGDAVTMMFVEKSGMQKGRVLGKHSGRLFSMNRFGAEISGYYSVLNAPENFTTGSTVSAASSFTISDGNGEITNFIDYGRYAIIAKEDSLHTFEIFVADDLGSKLDKIQPIISGTSIGPLSQPSTVKMRNQLMYPTRTEGFYSLDPVSSGESSGSAINVISQAIQNHVTKRATYEDCRATVFRQNALWAVSDFEGEGNSEVLVFDTLRAAWTRFTGWAVKDWGRFNDRLFFIENGSGTLYECFTSSFDDNNNPVESELFTKRFNFGAPAQQKVTDKVYLQGYITPSTELYVDVLFNEGGILDTQTYKISVDTANILVSEPLTDALGNAALGTVALGYLSSVPVSDVSIFRCYLGVDVGKGFHNIQLRFYANKAAWWAITGIAFNPQLNGNADESMVISPAELS